MSNKEDPAFFKDLENLIRSSVPQQKTTTIYHIEKSKRAQIENDQSNPFLLSENERLMKLIRQMELKIQDHEVLYTSFNELSNHYSNLKVKISSLEAELEDVKKENLNLNNELKKIYELKASKELQESYQINEKNLIECRKELDLWKNRYNILSMNKEKDLENLRSSLAVVSQTNFEKQLRNIRIKHDNEVEKLNQEIKRLSHILQVKEELLSKKTILPEFIEDNSQELNELKMKIHSDQILIDELRGQLQLRSGLSEKDIIRELENQLNNTKEDLDRIKQLFDLKIVQLHDITEKYERLESKLTEARTLEVKVVELQKILNEKIKELEIAQKNYICWQNKFNEIEIEFSKYKENQNLHLKSREALYEENCELKNILNEKLEEIRLLAEENSKYEHILKENSDSRSQLSDYQSKIDILIRENDELAKRILLFEGNLTADSIWESKIREFEYRISQLTREIERLLAIILLRDEEILLLKSNKNITTIISDDKYKIKYETLLKDFHLLESNMEINIRKIKELEEKFILLAHEKDILERNNKELLEIKFKIETEYNEFRIGHEKIKEEKAKMHGIHQEKANKITILETRITELDTIILKLKEETSFYFDFKVKFEQSENIIKNLKAEIEQLKNILKLKELELQKFSGKIALISEYEAKCNIFSIEISRLKEITVDKDQQISAFTLKISEYEKQILNLNLEISHLKQLISEKDNKSIEEYENRIAMLTSEIDRLKFQVSKKEKESVLKINEYEIKISTLISELEQSTLKFQGFKENDNRISILNIEIEKLKGFLSQKEEEISTLKQKIGRYSDYEKTIFLLYSEIDRLKLIMNEKDNEFKLKIDEYSIKFSNYSDLIFNNQKYTLEINNNKEKIITLENQLVLITKEYDKLKYSSNNEQELNSLKIKYSILEKNLIELKGIESRFRSSEEILFSFKEKNMKQLMIILLLCAEVDRLRENELIS